MNYRLLIRVVLFLLVGGLQACSSGADREMSITDSEHTFEFFAKYDKEKTNRVQAVINENMAPDLNVTGDYVDISTTLDDNTNVDLEKSPGRIRIKLDKEANSEASYRRVKTLCEKIKKVIDKP